MAYHLFRWIYTALYVPLAPLILLYLLLRPDSRRHLFEYLGLGQGDRTGRDVAEMVSPCRRVVWLHAVSVGEVLSALPIVERLDARVHLTTTIDDAIVVARRSGFAFASARFLPLDLPSLQGRLVSRLAPDCVLVSETDFWPNLLHALASRGIPTFLVNGRISHKIHGLYQRLGPFARRMFKTFDHLFVQTEQDAFRLEEIGVERARITVSGNTKYDASLRPPPPSEHGPMIDALLGSLRPRVVGGSTHPGEERILLDATAGRGATLVIAPRDIRRAPEIVRLAGDRGLRTVLFSTIEPGRATDADVIVVDLLGVLGRLYEGARAAFIGGSFDGSGGHNFLEAARHGVAVVCGPRMRNFHEDVDRFKAANAIIQVDDAQGVGRSLERFLADAGEAARRGRRGLDLLLAHKGAALRTASAIMDRITERPA